jgi:cell division protease FtsH
MDRLTAALRIAKVVARHEQRAQVDVECLQTALQFIEPCNRDTEATAAGVDPFSLARTSALPGGAALEASYQSEPQLRLSDPLARLKERLAATAWAKDLPAYAALEQVAGGSGERANGSAEGAARFDLEAAIAGAMRSMRQRAPLRDFQVAPLRARLDANLLGQDKATSLLCEELAISAWGLAMRPSPQVFVLIGPPASGKTLMTNLIAEEFPDRPLLTLQMASYQNEREGFGLTGLRFGWSEARPGRLTGFVWKNPRAIVVFDNIDCAHDAVQQLLMPLLTTGSLDDEYGFGDGAATGHPNARTVDFSDTILLFTTNGGGAVYEQPGFVELLAASPSQVIAQLGAALASGTNAHGADATSQPGPRARSFAVQLSQFTLLPFQPLSLPSLQAIARRHLAHFSAALELRGVLSEGIADDALAFALTLAQGPEINARELESVARELMQPFVRDCAGNAGASLLRVVLEPSPVLARLRECPPSTLQNQLLRRSERLRYRLTAERSGNTLNLVLNNFELERVRISSDYGGSGGFETEMPKQGFDAIYGHEHVKQRLRQVVRLLSRPATIAGAPLALPKGMLLYGSPGTGKTMLAKALAAEAELPFIAVTGPQLLDLAMIRSLFQRARKFAPSVVFIDEIDALGVRGDHGADFCINQLLTEIDGFSNTSAGGVFIIAATNFPQRVDPALIRSGRLDLFVEIPMLDRAARELFIARFHQLPHVEAWDAKALTDLSAGMSGADLEKVYRECALDLIRTGKDNVTQADLLEQINVIRYGQRISNPPLREQLEATAFHEAGHAVVSMVLTPSVRVQQVAIVPRRDSLGFTSYDNEAPVPAMNRAQVMNRMCVALAGRVAEARRFPASANGGGDDAGAASDLQMVSRLAWQAITEWGLDEPFGWFVLSALTEPARDALSEYAVERTRAWIEEARSKATDVIAEHWTSIEWVASYLQEHEILDGNTMRAMLA